MRAAREMPDVPRLWDRAEELARTLGRPGEVAALYEEVLARALGREQALSIGERAVQFYEEWFEDPARVVRILERVLELDPTADWAFDRLKLLLDSAGALGRSLRALRPRARLGDGQEAREPARGRGADGEGLRRPARPRHPVPRAAARAAPRGRRSSRAPSNASTSGRGGTASSCTPAAGAHPDAQARRGAPDAGARRGAVARRAGGRRRRRSRQSSRCCSGPRRARTAARRTCGRCSSACSPPRRRTRSCAGRRSLPPPSTDVPAVASLPQVRAALVEQGLGAAARRGLAARALRADRARRGPRTHAPRRAREGQVAEGAREAAPARRGAVREARRRRQRARAGRPRGGARPDRRGEAHEARRSSPSGRGASSAWRTCSPRRRTSARSQALRVELMMQAAAVRADRIGDAAGAIGLLSTVLAMRGVPDDGRARRSAQAWSRCSRPPAATRSASTSSSGSPPSRRARDARREALGRAAQLAARLGQNARAIALWERRVAQDERDGEALDGLVDLLDGRGQAPSALARVLDLRAQAAPSDGRGAPTGCASRSCSARCSSARGRDRRVARRSSASSARRTTPRWRWRRCCARRGGGRSSPSCSSAARRGRRTTRRARSCCGSSATCTASSSARRRRAVATYALRARGRRAQRRGARRAARRSRTTRRTGRAPSGCCSGRCAAATTGRRSSSSRPTACSRPRRTPSRREVLLEASEIAEKRAGDAGLAFEAMRRAFALAPGDERVAGEIARLAEAAGAWQALVDGVPRRHRRRGARRRRAAWRGCAPKIGAALETRLDDPRGALAAYLQRRRATRRTSRRGVRGGARRGQAGASGTSPRGWSSISRARARSREPGLLDAFERRPTGRARGTRRRGRSTDATAAGGLAGTGRARRRGARRAVAPRPARRRGRRARRRSSGRSRTTPSNAALLAALAQLQRRTRGQAAGRHPAPPLARDGRGPRLAARGGRGRARSVGDRALARSVLRGAARAGARPVDRRRRTRARRRSTGARGSPRTPSGRSRAWRGCSTKRATPARWWRCSSRARRCRSTRRRGASCGGARRASRSTGSAITSAGIALYRGLFDDDPRDEEAVSGSPPRTRELGRTRDLLVLRERQVDAAPDPAAARGAAPRGRPAADASSATGARAIDVAARRTCARSRATRRRVEALAAALGAEVRTRELRDLLAEQAGLAERGGDPGRAAELWSRAASIAEERLRDVEAAERYHAKVVALEPRAASFDALARLATARRDAAAAAQWLERLLEVVAPEGRVGSELRLADALVESGQGARAAERLEQALRDDAGRRGAAREAGRALSRAGAVGAARAARRRVGGARAGQVDADGAPARCGAPLRRALRRSQSWPSRCSSRRATSRPRIRRCAWGSPTRWPARSASTTRAPSCRRWSTRSAGGARRSAPPSTTRSRGSSSRWATARAHSSSSTPRRASIRRTRRSCGRWRSSRATTRSSIAPRRATARCSWCCGAARRPARSQSIARSEVLLELSAIAQRQGEDDRAREVLESALEAATKSDFEQERLERTLRARGDDETLVRVLEAKLAAARRVAGGRARARRAGRGAGRSPRKAGAGAPRAAARHRDRPALRRGARCGARAGARRRRRRAVRRRGDRAGRTARSSPGRRAARVLAARCASAAWPSRICATTAGRRRSTSAPSSSGCGRRRCSARSIACTSGSRTARRQGRVLALRVEVEAMEGGPRAASDAIYRLAALRLSSADTLDEGVRDAQERASISIRSSIAPKRRCGAPWSSDSEPPAPARSLRVRRPAAGARASALRRARAAVPPARDATWRRCARRWRSRCGIGDPDAGGVAPRAVRRERADGIAERGATWPGRWARSPACARRRATCGARST